MPDKIAVLIPCYNESKTVAKVIRDMRKALPESVIYVYDNNSTDGTDEIARKEGAVVRYEYQQGKGNVIRSMFRDIDAQCYLMVDGDDTYPAEFAAQTWLSEIACPLHILQRTNVLSIISETALSVVLSTAFSKVISRTL